MRKKSYNHMYGGELLYINMQIQLFSTYLARRMWRRSPNRFQSLPSFISSEPFPLDSVGKDPLELLPVVVTGALVGKEKMLLYLQ